MGEGTREKRKGLVNEIISQRCWWDSWAMSEVLLCLNVSNLCDLCWKSLDLDYSPQAPLNLSLHNQCKLELMNFAPCLFPFPLPKHLALPLYFITYVPILFINMYVHVFALCPFPKGRLRAELHAQWQQVLEAHVHIKPGLAIFCFPTAYPQPLCSEESSCALLKFFY